MILVLFVAQGFLSFYRRISYDEKTNGNSLNITEQSLVKLHKLLDDKPIEYVAMALSREPQAYCDIEADMVKGMFVNIVQSYLKQEYNKAMAEALARKFFRYES